MQKILVLDLETTFSHYVKADGKLTSDFGSPFNEGNRVYMAGVYDYTTDSYKSFDTTKSSGVKALRKVVESADVMIGHNIKYDALWLKSLGFDLSRITYRDTMLREYLIGQGNHEGLSLTEVAPRYGGTPKMDLMSMAFDKGINVDEMPTFVVAKYLYEDVMNTKLTYEGQLKRQELIEQKTYDAFYHDVLKVVIDMEFAGGKFNEDAKEAVSQEIEEKVFSTMETLINLSGKYTDKATFNPNSPQQLSKIIFGLKLKEGYSAEWKGFIKRFKPWEQGSQAKLEYMVEKCFDKLEDSLHVKPDVAWLSDRKFLTETGFSCSSKVIDSMLTTGKLTQKQDTYVAAVQAYSKASTWKTSNLFSMFDGVRDDGFVHGNLNMHITSTRRFSSSAPNCFPYDVEFLTEHGFMTFDKWNGEKVAQVDYNNDMLMNFDTPVEVHKYTQHVMEIGTRDWRVACTPEHRMLFQDRKTGKFKITSAIDTPQDMKVHNSYCYTGGVEHWTWSKAALFAAFQADGHLRKQDGIAEFGFSKKRKLDRLIAALEAEGVPYRTRSKNVAAGKHQTVVSVSRVNVPAYFTKALTGVNMYNLTLGTRVMLANELLLWDGRFNEYYAKDANNATWAQELFSSIGWRANIRHYDNKKGGSCYIVCLSKKGYSLTTNRVASWREGYAVPVWCFTMPKGTLVVRYKGKVTVTGNCQNFPREGTNPVKRLIKSRYEGGHIVAADYGQLEFRIAGMLSDDRLLIRDVADDFDIHSHTATVAFGDKFTQAEGKERKELRQKAKAKTFAFQYGATPKTKIDQLIFDAFYGKYTKLASWQEKTIAIIGRTQRYVCPYTGVVFAFPEATTYNEYMWATRAKNYPIQFLSDAINKCALVGIHNRIAGRDDIKLVFTVHDSDVLDAAPHAIEEAKQILREEMEGVTKTFEKYFQKSLDIPLKVDVSSGSTWFDQD